MGLYDDEVDDGDDDHVGDVGGGEVLSSFAFERKSNCVHLFS